MQGVGGRQPQGLVDILDKILDKGLVIAGDIKVNLANVELLTIQLRLVVCSIDKAEEIGLGWWRNDRFYSGRALPSPDDVRELRERVAQLESQLNSVASPVKSGKRGGTTSGKSGKDR
jgi:hypothetical protein